MKKTLRIILIVMISIIGLLSFYILADEFFRNTAEISRGSYVLDDYTLLIPAIIFLLSIFSLVFNVKTLKFFRESKVSLVSIDHPGIIDSDLKHTSSKISLVYWIGNLLFGLSIVLLGIMMFTVVIVNFPISEFPKGFYRYLLVIAVLILGISILVDEWKVNKQINGV